MAKQPKPGEWRYTVGEPPCELTAFEREDRNLDIYTRVWTGKKYKDKNRLLAKSIRDERGRLIPEREIEVQKLAMARQKAASSGVESPAYTGPLTLKSGFARLLDKKMGKFPGDTPWRADQVRYSEIITKVLCEDGDVLWEDARHAHYRKLWRWMAQQHRDHGTYGVRYAEKIVGALQACCTWLQEEGLLAQGVGLPARGWRKKLKAEWTDITDKPVGEPKKLRHTSEEQDLLWAALPFADSRLEIALEVCAELRLGQGLRTRRTDMQPYAGHAVGRVTVHGRGKKEGADVILTNDQRAVIERAMSTGVLAELEQAYQAKEIEDYFMVPGGRLHMAKLEDGTRVWRASVKWAAKPWTDRLMNRAFHQMETIAGVEQVDGRAWYGVRRKQSDRAEDASKDDRVLNKMGGWTNTKTRQNYQEEGRVEILEQVADVRAQIRPNAERRKELQEQIKGRAEQQTFPKKFPQAENLGKQEPRTNA